MLTGIYAYWYQVIKRHKPIKEYIAYSRVVSGFFTYVYLTYLNILLSKMTFLAIVLKYINVYAWY
jgi:hypothetical protein